MSSSSTICASCTQRLRISPWPSHRSMDLSLVLNSIRPRRVATRCPVTTNEAVYFYQVDRFGFGITLPDCLIGRKMIPFNETFTVLPLKRDGMKDLSKASSTRRNASLMYGVTLWMKYHYFWRYFFIPI